MICVRAGAGERVDVVAKMASPWAAGRGRNGRVNGEGGEMTRDAAGSHSVAYDWAGLRLGLRDVPRRIDDDLDLLVKVVLLALGVPVSTTLGRLRLRGRRGVFHVWRESARRRMWEGG